MDTKKQVERNSDNIGELQKYINEKKIEEGIRKGISKWAHTICMTATSAVMSIVYYIGGIVYDKWEQFSAAIDAFIKAGRQ